MSLLPVLLSVPTNGLVVYCGTIVTDEGKEKKVNIDFEPFKPINTSLYLCDNKFHTEVWTSACRPLIWSSCLFGTTLSFVQNQAHYLIYTCSAQLSFESWCCLYYCYCLVIHTGFIQQYGISLCVYIVYCSFPTRHWTPFWLMTTSLVSLLWTVTVHFSVFFAATLEKFFTNSQWTYQRSTVRFQTVLDPCACMGNFLHVFCE